MSLRSRIVTLFVILWLPEINLLTAQSRLAIPDVSLEVTVRQKEDGEISKDLHIFDTEAAVGTDVNNVLGYLQSMTSKNLKNVPSEQSS